MAEWLTKTTNVTKLEWSKAGRNLALDGWPSPGGAVALLVTDVDEDALAALAPFLASGMSKPLHVTFADDPSSVGGYYQVRWGGRLVIGS